MIDPTRRFSGRVENYVKYRPVYPPGVLDLLRAECGFTPASTVADVGSGTGILSEMFLKNGNTVYGVEPNREMREAGEALLRSYSNFTSVPGTAEATTLPSRSVDFITAGQAFHWFRPAAARRELARILKPGGWVVLVWNDRRTATSPFLAAYEQLLAAYGTDYAAVKSKNVDDATLARFFEPAGFERRVFDNRQLFDFDGLKGRLLSSSYAPDDGHPNHEPMLHRLAEIFEEYQVGGRVAFEYDTLVYYGHLTGVGETTDGV